MYCALFELLDLHRRASSYKPLFFDFVDFVVFVVLAAESQHRSLFSNVDVSLVCFLWSPPFDGGDPAEMIFENENCKHKEAKKASLCCKK